MKRAFFWFVLSGLVMFSLPGAIICAWLFENYYLPLYIIPWIFLARLVLPKFDRVVNEEIEKELNDKTSQHEKKNPGS